MAIERDIFMRLQRLSQQLAADAESLNAAQKNATLAATNLTGADLAQGAALLQSVRQQVQLLTERLQADQSVPDPTEREVQ